LSFHYGVKLHTFRCRIFHNKLH